MTEEILTAPAPRPKAKEADFLPIHAIDHLEFIVGNAKQSAYFYRSAFGFKLTAYAGLETGLRDRASYLLEQGKIRFVLTTPLISDHPHQDHLRLVGENRLLGEVRAILDLVPAEPAVDDVQPGKILRQ